MLEEEEEEWELGKKELRTAAAPPPPQPVSIPSSKHNPKYSRLHPRDFNPALNRSDISPLRRVIGFFSAIAFKARRLWFKADGTAIRESLTCISILYHQATHLKQRTNWQSLAEQCFDA